MACFSSFLMVFSNEQSFNFDEVKFTNYFSLVAL